jgi:hypothetical protein
MICSDPKVSKKKKKTISLVLGSKSSDFEIENIEYKSTKNVRAVE